MQKQSGTGEGAATGMEASRSRLRFRHQSPPLRAADLGAVLDHGGVDVDAGRAGGAVEGGTEEDRHKGTYTSPVVQHHHDWHGASSCLQSPQKQNDHALQQHEDIQDTGSVLLLARMPLCVYASSGCGFMNNACKSLFFPSFLLRRRAPSFSHSHTHKPSPPPPLPCTGTDIHSEATQSRLPASVPPAGRLNHLRRTARAAARERAPFFIIRAASQHHSKRNKNGGRPPA